MDYKDFTKRDYAYRQFVAYRKEVLDSVDTDQFVEIFTELCTKALSNDCIAQDCCAYFFNKGIPDSLYPNFDNYMGWQILAGANGNEFALEKMQFMLNSGIDAILNEPNLLKEAMLKNNITKENALMVISNLICEGIVDELQIEPRKLINISNQPVLYSSNKNRVYLEAMEKCLPKVANFLLT